MRPLVNKRLCLAFLLLLLQPSILPGSDCGGRLITEVSADGVYQADIAVPPVAYTANWVANFAKCTSIAKRSEFVRVQFREDQPVGLQLGWHPIPQGFLAWAMIRDQEIAKRVKRAQVHCIRGNCVLRFVDRDGRFEVRVLSGDNPLVMDVGGMRFEVLDTWWSSSSDGFRAYVRTDVPLEEATAMEVYNAVSKRLPLLVRRFYVRNDIWFIENSFPQYYPFAAQQDAPTKAEFDKTITLVCGVWKEAPTCMKWGGN